MKNLLKNLLITSSALFLILFFSISTLSTSAFASTLDPNTKSLLHFDGTNGSSVFTDESGYPVTSCGKSQISTDQSKFGGASGSFTNSDSCLKINAGPSALDMGTGDFTIDFWVMIPGSLNNLAQVYQNTTSTTLGANDIAIHVNHIEHNNCLCFYANSYDKDKVMLYSTTTISTKTWYHIAICRSNGVCTLYVNGKAESTAKWSGSANLCLDSYVLGAGLWQSGSNGYMNGNIDEFRISNIARWTSNFTPPTRSYGSTLAGPTLTASVGDNQVILTWNSVQNATSYTIKRYTKSGDLTSDPATFTSTTTSFTDSSVTNKTYYYVVTAIDSAGESNNSNEVTATPRIIKETLKITLSDNTEKVYELGSSEVNAFLDWYDKKADGTGKSYYIFNITNNLGPYISWKEYIIFDKIRDFDVMQYA